MALGVWGPPKKIWGTDPRTGGGGYAPERGYTLSRTCKVATA
eukprot:CAMPEP_0180611358 /NCGR_PEP_ID=MMETSP1037_2-20121125/29764_1 /TAXON_ID=632150 /ORGANISM="Azadinium spinosum, Strain 3D9" /LENGTH=41 /DNA_ID= /DNA_START= /DNA_END= /DNA_ORIENTATION=